ncbi:hypothetical protein KMP13_16760 [Epibacterium ulvae]|nr:hypothetical protein [Epibacterium ulvae]
MSGPENAINDLCAVSAREMRQLQEKVQVLEDVVLTVFERGTKPNSQEIRALQDFDLVSQTLAGMWSFFETLREQNVETGSADIDHASAGVTLEKLRLRLRDHGDPTDV